MFRRNSLRVNYLAIPRHYRPKIQPVIRHRTSRRHESVKNYAGTHHVHVHLRKSHYPRCYIYVSSRKNIPRFSSSSACLVNASILPGGVFIIICIGDSEVREKAVELYPEECRRGLSHQYRFRLQQNRYVHSCINLDMYSGGFPCETASSEILSQSPKNRQPDQRHTSPRHKTCSCP